MSQELHTVATTSAQRPLLSVVVIGRNEGERLRYCLESVQQLQALPGLVEVIYVDSGSTDGSTELAYSLGALVLQVDSERPSAARGRNVGWRQASAPQILFLDADTIIAPCFAAQALAALADPAVAVVWGTRRELRPQDSVYNRVLDLDWLAPAGDSDYCGGDALMRREALEMTGGYDETLIAGEEPDLCRRMRGFGLRILHIDLPMTGHDLAITRWAQYWKRAVRTGYAYREVANRYRHTDLPLWRAEARANCHRALFWLVIVGWGAGAGAYWRSGWPILIPVGLLAGLALRSARRFSWKSEHLPTLFCYGLHSHIQQLPIFCGQLRYWYLRSRGRRQQLLEYKGRSL